jgi:hypothetical protein
MGDIPLIKPGNAKQDMGPVFRLLYCLVCNTLEELPPFEGKPENDVTLTISCEKHVFPSGDPHKGRLFIMPVKEWIDEKKRKAIIEQIRGGGSKGLGEIDNTYYDSKSTFSEDALKCFSAHNRPQNGCGDYERDDKRLVPESTKADRKELGLPSAASMPGPKVYLCHFCPVHSTVTTRKRKLLGMYND